MNAIQKGMYVGNEERDELEELSCFCLVNRGTIQEE